MRHSPCGLCTSSIWTGVLAVVVAAYLAAVRLAADANRLDDPSMTTYFRRRALGAALVAGVAVAVGIAVLHSDAPYLFASRALGIVIGSAVLGGASLFSWRGANIAGRPGSRPPRSRPWCWRGVWRSTRICCRRRSPSRTSPRRRGPLPRYWWQPLP